MGKCKVCKGIGIVYSEYSRWGGIIILPQKVKCSKCQGRGK